MQENNIRMSRISHPRGTGWAFVLLVAVFAAIGATLTVFAEPQAIEMSGQALPSAKVFGDDLWQCMTQWLPT